MNEGAGFGLPGPVEIIVILCMALVVIIPFWKIFSKAGYPGVLSLLMPIPFVNLILIFFLAFAPWPALKKN